MDKRCTVIIEEFNSSGGLKILTAIINLLAENSINVRVLTQKSKSFPYYPLNDKIDIEYVGNDNYPSKFLFFIYLFFKLLRINELILTTNFRIAVISFISIAMKLNFKKVVFLIQGLDNISIISNNNLFIKNLNKLIYYISKNIRSNKVFVSNYVFSKYKKKGVVIHNYVSEVFLTDNKILFNKNKICIGVVSTSSPNKGFNFFLECISKISEALFNSDYEVKFICATQDRKLVSSNSLEEVEFVFPKNESEMSSFYSRCDVFLSCSISEGFNLPVLEAMASGCIVISTDDGAVNDLITNDLNGYVIDIRDAHLFSSKLFELLKDGDKINNVSKEARIRAAKFSKVYFDESYLKYFRDIL